MQYLPEEMRSWWHPAFQRGVDIVAFQLYNTLQYLLISNFDCIVIHARFCAGDMCRSVYCVKCEGYAGQAGVDIVQVLCRWAEVDIVLCR